MSLYTSASNIAPEFFLLHLISTVVYQSVCLQRDQLRLMHHRTLFPVIIVYITVRIDSYNKYTLQVKKTTIFFFITLPNGGPFLNCSPVDSVRNLQ